MDTEAAQAIIDFAKRNGEVHKENRYRFDAVNHVHTLDGKPLMGTSTIAKVLGGDFAFYGSGHAVMAFGVPDPKVLTKLKNGKATEGDELVLYRGLMQAMQSIAGMTTPEYAKLCTKAYFAHKTNLVKTGKEGTATHKELESYVQSCIDETGGEPQSMLNYNSDAVVVFSEWACEHIKRFIWSEKNCYSEKLWVGGVSDCGAVLANNRRAVIDFKRSGCFFNQFVQAGGYALQIAEHGLFDSEGNEFMSPWHADDVIVFPNKGNPRIESASDYMLTFAGVTAIYQRQQQYEAAT